MLSRLYKSKSDIPSVCIDNKTRVLISSSVSDGRVLSIASSYKDLSVSDLYKGFTYYDFCLANLYSIGAVDRLNPVIMDSCDVVGISENLDNLLNSAKNEDSK